jgi:hypothetical protein
VPLESFVKKKLEKMLAVFILSATFYSDSKNIQPEEHRYFSRLSLLATCNASGLSALKPAGIQPAICAKNKFSLFSECGNVVSFFYVSPKCCYALKTLFIKTSKQIRKCRIYFDFKFIDMG